MSLPTDVPLVWTIKGNLPVMDLQYETEWQNTDDYIKFIERYKLDGEVVKESAHVLAKHGVSSEAVQQSF